MEAIATQHFDLLSKVGFQIKTQIRKVVLVFWDMYIYIFPNKYNLAMATIFLRIFFFKKMHASHKLSNLNSIISLGDKDRRC